MSPAPGRPDWSPWWAAPGRSGVLTDFDGTLAPIVEDPALAAPLHGVPQVLASLARHLAVVGVVSGRPLDFLQRHLGSVPGLRLFGLYGMERAVGDRVEVGPEAAAWRPVVHEAAARARRELPAGAEVEGKGLAVALHARRRPELHGVLLEWAARVAAGSGLRVQPGRLSVELLPPVGPDKGRVVEEVATGLGAICFFGDDAGDLPAFSALAGARRAGAVTVGVGVRSSEGPEGLTAAVDFMVDGPDGALGSLRALARGLQPDLGVPVLDRP